MTRRGWAGGGEEKRAKGQGGELGPGMGEGVLRKMLRDSFCKKSDLKPFLLDVEINFRRRVYT